MDLTTVVDLTPSSKLALKVCKTSCRVFWVCPKDKGELRGVTPPYGTTIWRIIRTRWVTIIEQELTWSWRLQSANVILLFIASDCIIMSIVQFLDISASSLVSVLYRHWQSFPSPSFLLRISFREGGGKLLPDSPTSVEVFSNFLEWIAPTILMNIMEVGCLGMKREMLERPWGYY